MGEQDPEVWQWFPADQEADPTADGGRHREPVEECHEQGEDTGGKEKPARVEQESFDHPPKPDGTGAPGEDRVTHL
ncbi:hypothetical protein ACFVH7_09495 [Kitasatospora indigofera]|uniref:hypothetical protein n=1 Tax=Kitasatospora indigofera TaxID=67307 RepID=UPI0036384864